MRLLAMSDNRVHACTYWVSCVRGAVLHCVLRCAAYLLLYERVVILGESSAASWPVLSVTLSFAMPSHLAVSL